MIIAELIEQLKHLPPEKNVTISIDISTNDDNAGWRAFGEEYFGFIHNEEDEFITLLFDGYENGDYEF